MKMSVQPAKRFSYTVKNYLISKTTINTYKSIIILVFHINLVNSCNSLQSASAFIASG